MSPSQIIVLATPVFLLMIVPNTRWSRARGRNTYRLNDAINSISLGILSQLSGLFTKLLRLGIYTAVYHAVAPWPDLPFWSTWRRAAGAGVLRLLLLLAAPRRP
jgi:alkylglycerol monooxygenase